jgi:hypothetical protein
MGSKLTQSLTKPLRIFKEDLNHHKVVVKQTFFLFLSQIAVIFFGIVTSGITTRSLGRGCYAVISEATLVEQPRGKELEYRIIAVNKSGEGEPSNTAMVVL